MNVQDPQIFYLRPVRTSPPGYHSNLLPFCHLVDLRHPAPGQAVWLPP
jgi:hypothetical protein